MTSREATMSGIQAFNNGLKAAPALNKAFIAKAITQADFCDLMRDYVHGWTLANLAKDSPDDMPSVKRLKAFLEGGK